MITLHLLKILAQLHDSLLQATNCFLWMMELLVFSSPKPPLLPVTFANVRSICAEKGTHGGIFFLGEAVAQSNSKRVCREVCKLYCLAT